ncbi:hypothetical protein H0A36_18985 [Endozoicomonas sp. SM1973]|uniref:Uncharacterized protein n=1 Tax=Spartinivicinus marinus TaxID=2994442 RepID=A0A853IG37_9GAMM|nr:hypothetical protein [Spartinivicinus marinus]MCX4025920.1 hypothetical protein [Spartinivicinus marinus]NYZ68105.1 hypothetical protein [Spartinivicinus marinus]
MLTIASPANNRNTCYADNNAVDNKQLMGISTTRKNTNSNNQCSGLVKSKVNQYKDKTKSVASKNTCKVRAVKEQSPFRGIMLDLISINSNRLKSVSFNKLLMNTSGVGDIVSRSNLPEDFPDIRPAQEAVIPYVLEQKKHYLNASTKPIIIDVWQNPRNKALYIQDGQHRFVAACILGKQVLLRLKKMGFSAFNGSWGQTKYIDTLAAKDRIKV